MVSVADPLPFSTCSVEDKDVARRAPAEVESWRKTHQVQTFGKDIPKPVTTFEEAGLPEYVLAEIRKAGFSNPSPIQSQAWPMALSGRDLVGVSATGSGKTIAFSLPAMIHINA